MNDTVNYVSKKRKEKNSKHNHTNEIFKVTLEGLINIFFRRTLIRTPLNVINIEQLA